MPCNFGAVAKVMACFLLIAPTYVRTENGKNIGHQGVERFEDIA